jgi:chromosome segregation ATPase
MNTQNFEELAAARRTLEDRIKSVQQELRTADEQRGSALAQQREAKNAMTGYSDGAKKDADDLTRSRYENARQVFEAKDRIFQEADRHHKAIETQLAELQEELSRFDHWDMRMRAALIRYQEAQAEMVEPQRDIENLQDQIKSLEPEIRQVNAEIQKQKDIIGSALNKTDLATAKNKAAQYQEQLADLVQLKDNLSKRLPVLQENLKTIQSRLDKVGRAVWLAKLDGLKEEFRERNQDLIEAILAAGGKAGTAYTPQVFSTVLAQLFAWPTPDQLKDRQGLISREIGLLE